MKVSAIALTHVHRTARRRYVLQAIPRSMGGADSGFQVITLECVDRAAVSASLLKAR
jgi:hypothetical protein